MASTPTQGFPYPVPNDPPDVPSDIRALAEALDTKITADDATIADLATRVAALEDGTGGVGWIPIATGSSSGTSFTIDLTDGGRFPDPPLWNMVQVDMRVDLSDVGGVAMRFSGETSNIYRSGSFQVDSANNFDTENWHLTNANHWRIAHLSTISTGVLSLKLFHTAANPGLIPFQCKSSRQSDDPSVQRHTIASGSLISTGVTVSSLQFLPTAGATNINNAWWWATGLRTVHPS